MARRHLRAATSPDLLVNLNARIPRSLWRRVRVRSFEENRLIRTFVAEALHDYLRANKKP